MHLKLERVRAMPAALDEGVLYVSEEFETAAHLCACGCGSKIRTPLGPTEWTFRDGPAGPSLWPSVGNWQRPCQSHYVIADGEVRWAGQWSEKQIIAGREREEQRRTEHYRQMYAGGWLRKLWRRIKALFGR